MGFSAFCWRVKLSSSVSRRDISTTVHFSASSRRRAATLSDKISSISQAPEGMEETRRSLGAVRPGMRIGVFIGPEGGFEEEEVALAIQSGIRPLTLGRRILRTETAGLYVLSVLGFLLEETDGSMGRGR